MDEKTAREQVIKAGLELVSSGLIARTWGNVSCRLDDESFVVTPSGRAYDTLAPEDLVICKIADASYSGEVKPSSEKGVHALVYREKKDAGFVIHTHQKWASAVSASRISRMRGDARIGAVPMAAYGLPGTKKLMDGVSAVLGEAINSVFMAHHGALCFGGSYEDAFAAAHALEDNCESLLVKACAKKSGKGMAGVGEALAYLANVKYASVSDAKPLGDSRRDGDGFILSIDGGETRYALNGNMPTEARFHRAVYLARPDASFIKYSGDDAIKALASARKSISPMLDDFAQMVGLAVKSADIPADVEKIVKADRQGVLIFGFGALCFASTEGDAHAVKLIMEKTALSQLAASIFSKPKPIALWECALMRHVYKTSYSKRA